RGKRSFPFAYDEKTASRGEMRLADGGLLRDQHTGQVQTGQFGLGKDDPVFLWVFQTQDNSSDLGPGFTNVTSHGIFSSSQEHWNFNDPSGDLPAFSHLRTEEIDQFHVWSGVETSSGVDEGSLSLYSLGGIIVIPEPSALALLTALCVGATVLRRRR
ncbi:MAG: PEP-CTERM sorting domain-containing protein, partial [Opitutales bacterium]